jgi:pyruvate formate lyase activating enzyme
MDIKGFIDTSLIDWDGKVSSVVFLPGCNLRCPFCHNSSLVLNGESMQTIPLSEIEEYLRRNRHWIEGVVITGGEPTIHGDLLDLCREMRKLEMLVKVDSNGTNPKMIKQLIDKELVDFVAMDVKAPLIEEEYSKACGVNTRTMLGSIRETVELLLKGDIKYEFRTTFVPGIHKKEDVELICQELRGCDKYFLQKFRAGVKTMNPEFESLKPFSERTIKTFLRIAKNMIPNASLRG